MDARRRARPRHAPGESLAYVFYHRPRSGVGRAEYERALRAFHDGLARRPTPGFRASAALRIPRAPWETGRNRPLYVDWYVLSGFGDLDPIREVAYRSPWVELHRAVAFLFGEGGAALYATRAHADPPSAPDTVTWFSGPEGPGRARLGRWWMEGAPRGTLWRRQLALGPSPEFCYFGPGAPPTSLAPRSAVMVPEYLPIPRPARGSPK